MDQPSKNQKSEKKEALKPKENNLSKDQKANKQKNNNKKGKLKTE